MPRLGFQNKPGRNPPAPPPKKKKNVFVHIPNPQCCPKRSSWQTLSVVCRQSLHRTWSKHPSAEPTAQPNRPQAPGRRAQARARVRPSTWPSPERPPETEFQRAGFSVEKTLPLRLPGKGLPDEGYLDQMRVSPVPFRTPRQRTSLRCKRRLI